MAGYEETYRLLQQLYAVLAFGVCLGAVQVAATVSGIRGMWLMPQAGLNAAVGAALIALTVVFFLTAPLWTSGPWAAGSIDGDSSNRQWGKASVADFAGAYNINDTDGGLSGTDQGRIFPIAAVLAVGASLVAGFLGSLFRRNARELAPAEGLEGLKSRSYPGVLATSLAGFYRSWREDLRTQFKPGTHKYGFVTLAWRIARGRTEDRSGL